jgi:aflatoxin B1 aldehyde reductase
LLVVVDGIKGYPYLFSIFFLSTRANSSKQSAYSANPRTTKMTNTTVTTPTDTPRIILGTMTFGLESTDARTSAVRVRGVDAVAPFLTTFNAHGHTEVDTARIYSNGDTETVLSQLPTAHLKVATKAYAFAPGSHNKENLSSQVRKSLKALNAEKVDILYLHVPDYDTPYEETCKAIDDLYKEGLFERVS